MTLEERHLLVGLSDGNLLIISRQTARPAKAGKNDSPRLAGKDKTFPAVVPL